MHEQLQKLIDETRAKLNLTNFHLKRHHFFREKDHNHKVTYILNMEWFPTSAVDETDDFNPPGAVSIDIDFHTGQMKSLIFVDGINQLETELPTSDNSEAAIEWVEEETGLEFGRQFKLMNTDGADLIFLAAADHIPVFPSGYIELEFNEEGKLSLYSIHGNFPDAEKINWEPFSLTESETKAIIKNQCSLLEVPIVEEEQWRNVYVVSSSFITNDGKQVLSYEEVEADRTYVKLDQVLNWNKQDEPKFATREIDQSTEVTLVEVLENKDIPTAPLTEAEIETSINMTKDYLQSIQPEASDKWKITSLQREENYIFAILKLVEEEVQVITRKLTIVLDAETLEPINHIDNEVLLDTFKEFSKASPAKLTVEEAFETLYNYIEVTPVYVYDRANDQYRLCGRIDSEIAVDATTGEVIEMEALN